ncbi:putative homeodomain transcription factor [Pseudomyrmex gracilis]|uniref:putative homeodomain transcription factor n=1 Tax=Pseudomyrmex gracilis TaxID=219809 RepID=UPI0009955ADD|nr:putative homeodomain transcription factor [Pseudomyrmex gracilis]XP_020278733.1 putative homeodomain transcription factor [Pseudomyrmex gracilis]
MPLGMGLNRLVHWYQKKIGTYDKQQWERTIEQHILDGLTHVPMRTAKLKTELIDVDLVRGSSFPKAKPKHGLSTVACLAFQRLLFLPFCKKWWIEQTSFRIFALFLLLYSLQAVNMTLYYMFTHRENEPEIVSMSEVLVPVVMMFVLCIVHSHIVSTHSGPPLKYNQSKLRIPRRSRREARCRNGKSRSRQSLSMHKDSKSQEMVSEKASTGSEEVFTSVRFAKKVLIENSSTVGQSTKESASAQLVYEKESIKKDKISTNEENSNPTNESSANREQPDNMAEEHVASIHQDDDGFESLNGNVSSDNDKVGGRIQVQRNRSRAGTTRQTKDRTSWSEDSASQQISPPSKRSAPDPLKNDGNFTDSKSNLNSIKDKDAPSKIMGSRETRQQCESEEEGECEEATTHHLTEATTSATEWMGVTTNSDECSSELGESDLPSETNLNYGEFVEHPFSWEFELPPSILLNSTCTSSDRVSCTIWTRRDIKKAELSVLDISSAIIARVESMPESMNYFYSGLILSISLCLIPSIKRLSDHIGSDNVSNASINLLPNDIIQETYLFNFETYTDVLCKVIGIAFGNTFCERTVVLISMFERFLLSCFLFFLLAVAERTYKQRLLYAKLFSHLTSSRRARKSDLPHFRLNKVRNIKTWLSVRSYLKRRGPQRSVDVIVSAVFIVTILLLSFVSLELIKDLETLHSRYNVEALFWSFSLGIFILRFMTLGTKINKKYRNLSVLITEQINLYLQIEQKPHKKEELMVANSVLKLAADLIKELESPFKISGLSANPYLYTITKVVLLSALSGVLSELLGFKLKLHKIKIK